MGGSLLDAAYRLLIYVTGAVTAVLLLRLPLRQAFGPQLAYRVWLLVPIAAVGGIVSSLAPVMALAPIAIPIQMPSVPPTWSTLPAVQTLPGETNWFIVCWIIGAVVFALLQWWQQRTFVHRLGSLHCTSSGAWMAEVNDVGPVVIGVFPPKIVLPADFHQRYAAQEQVLVLAHEYAHIARRDPLANFATAVIRSLLWFHPLVHLAIRYFRIDQEFACDAAVLKVHSRDRYHYAHAMLKGSMGGLVLPAGCHLDSQAATFLKRRIIMLQTVPPSRWRRTLGTVVTFVLLMTGLALTLPSSAFAQTTVANLIGTWVRQPDYDAIQDMNFSLRSDSTFTLTIEGSSQVGRTTKLTGDTATVQLIDPDNNQLEVRSFVIALNDQKLTVRDPGPEGDMYVFKRTDAKP